MSAKPTITSISHYLKSAPMKLLLVAPVFCFLSACETFDFPGVYRIEVPQGNVFTQEMVDKLSVGMTRSQARYVMGTPLITDSFNQERWDYAFSRQRGTEIYEKKALSLYFEGDKLIRFEGDIADLPSEDGDEALSEKAVKEATDDVSAVEELAEKELAKAKKQADKAAKKEAKKAQ